MVGYQPLWILFKAGFTGALVALAICAGAAIALFPFWVLKHAIERVW